LNLNEFESNGLGTLGKSVFGVSGDIYEGKLLESIRLRRSKYSGNWAKKLTAKFT
jgi:hypothetical protein